MFTKRRLVELDPLNRQVPPSDFVHFLLDGFQVALGDGFHRKVVVEASVNGRANRGQGARIQRHDRLSEQVGGRVAKDVHAFI